MTGADEIWTLVNSQVAQVWEIERHWSLGRLFDAVDALAYAGDLATWLNPPQAPPQGRR